MISPKKAMLLAESLIKIVIAVIGLVILIFLAAKLYGLFDSNQTENLANAELENLIAYFNSVEKEKIEKNYIVLTAKEWWMLTSEFGTICNANFCLCLCEEKNCEGFKACKATDKFVVLREGEREVRFFQLNSPSTLKVNLDLNEAYPFNVAKNVDFSLGILWSSATPLFYRFDKSWKWSPDLKNWMDSKQTSVVGGFWNEKEPSDWNLELISKFSEKVSPTDQSVGDSFFKVMGVTKSKGFYTITK